jgi:tetratricopeptide (TPR) repeat protein
MFRKDYLVGMIEDMTSMIAKAFGLKEQKKYTEALWELDDLMRKNFRLNSELVNRMPTNEIIEMFRIGPTVEVDQLQGLARILRAESDIYEASDKQEEAVVRRIKALHLFLYSAVNGADRSLLNYPEHVDELLDQLEEYVLPAAVEKLMVEYEEQEGYYDNAVDALQRLNELDAAEGMAAGAAFYERLHLKTDEQLEAGGLTRTDVEEGRSRFQN